MSPVEEWRAIPGWPGYMASSEGRVRSHVRDSHGVLMATMVNPSNGYLTVGPSIDKKQIVTPVRVLVSLAFNGPRPDGCVTRHLDGNPHNNRADNLAWGTYVENAQDMLRHGTESRRLAERSHCKNGHPFIELTTHVIKTKSGETRRCRVCDTESRLRSAERDLAMYRAALATHEPGAA